MTMTNKYATRDQVFASPVNRRFAIEDADGFGKVRIRSLTAREKTRYDAAAVNSKGGMSTKGLLTANARLIVLCIVDGDGNQLFTDADIDKLLDKDAGEIERLATTCGKHCGIIEDDEDTVKN